MSDWTTIRAAVIDDWGIPDVATEQARVERALCEALRVLRPMEFSFNRGLFSLTTVADQATYARATPAGGATLLPYDFWGMLGREIWNDTLITGRRIRRANPARLRERSKQLSAVSSGTPRYFTVERQQLTFYPAPSAAYTITGAYRVDLGTPVPFRSSSSVTYQLAQGWDSSSNDITATLNSSSASTVAPFGSSPAADATFYLAWPRRIASPVMLNVSTAGVGAYAVTWKYWDGNQFSALSGVTDNTNALKVSGSNTLVFTDPSDWQSSVVNGSDQVFFLAGVHDGGAQTTDPELEHVAASGADAWEFYLEWPGGREWVGPEYTSEWFLQAFKVLSHGTAYQYLKGYRKDTERANAALELYQDAISTLRAAEGAFISTGDVRLSLGY